MPIWFLPLRIVFFLLNSPLHSLKSPCPKLRGIFDGVCPMIWLMTRKKRFFVELPKCWCFFYAAQWTSMEKDKLLQTRFMQLLENINGVLIADLLIHRFFLYFFLVLSLILTLQTWPSFSCERFTSRQFECLSEGERSVFIFKWNTDKE